MTIRSRRALLGRGAAVAAVVAATACTAPQQGSDAPVAGAPASAASAPTASGGSFTLAVAAPSLRIERTKSVTVAVSVARVAPFAGPVRVTVSSAESSSAMPPGLVAASLTIPPGQRIGALTIAASAAAKFGANALAVRGVGTGGVAPNSTPLALAVGRATGDFAEATPAPYASTVPSNVTSHTAAFRVEVSAGAPGQAQARKAVFFRGAIPLGSPIDFTLGPAPTLGGAGFCDDLAAGALARGVVLSGALPGFASQNVVTFVDLTGSPVTLRQLSADMQSTTPRPRAFAPRVFFSPDCSIALVAGVNRLGPSNHLLQLIDLTSGNRLGSDVGFNSTSFAAKLRSVGSAQELEVTVDAGTATARTVVVALP